MKRTVSILICMLMLAACAACQKAEPAAEPTAAEPLSAGRYVESGIPLPLPEGADSQMLLGVSGTPDGGLTVFTAVNLGEAQNYRNEYYRHTISPDGTTTTTPESWLSDMAPYGGNELHVLTAADGAIYMCYSDYDEKGNSQEHLLVSPDDGRTGASIPGDGVCTGGIITSFGVLDDGRIAVADFYEGSLRLTDREGVLLCELSSDSKGRISSCAAGGRYVAFTVPDSHIVRVYDADSQSYTNYDFTFSKQGVAQLAVTADGAVLLADSTGVYRHAAGGTVWEKLVDGETATLGLPSFYAGFLTAVESGAYPTLYTGDIEKLVAYRYDPDATSMADKELSVFSLYDNETVRQAIVMFSRAHSDVRVSYTVAMENATGGTEQDYIKALNTELLAGTGPDIIVLDGLPVDSYIEKDVLAELGEVLAGAEETLGNITSACLRDGALYAVPTGFLMPIAVAVPGTESAFDSLSALAAAAEAAGETPLLSRCAYSYETLALQLIKYYGGALKTADADGIKAFLTDAQRISAATGCTDRLGEGWSILKDFPPEDLYEMCTAYVGTPQLMMALSGKAQDILMEPVGSIMSCMEPVAVAEQLGASLVSVGGQYVPVGVVGVNKASAEPEAANAFVQALLSYGAQGGNQYANQFPVNAQALSEMLSRENDGVSSGYTLDDGTEFTAMWPQKVWRDRLGELIRGLDAPMWEDAALTDMLLPEITGCLSGAATESEAAGRIESLMATYLSE